MAKRTNGAGVSISREAIEALTDYDAMLEKEVTSNNEGIEKEYAYMSNEENVAGGESVEKVLTALRNVLAAHAAILEKVQNTGKACQQLREKYGITLDKAGQSFDAAAEHMYNTITKIREQGA